MNTPAKQALASFKYLWNHLITQHVPIQATFSIELMQQKVNDVDRQRDESKPLETDRLYMNSSEGQQRNNSPVFTTIVENKSKMEILQEKLEASDTDVYDAILGGDGLRIDITMDSFQENRKISPSEAKNDMAISSLENLKE